MSQDTTELDDDPEAERSDLSTETMQIVVSDEMAAHRLDRLLAIAFPTQSRTRLKGLIEGGHVQVDGKPILDANMRPKLGQSLNVIIPASIATDLKAQDIPLDVVFEDDHLIVINKPAGMVVHPAAGNPDGTLVNALLAHCGTSLKGIGGETRPGIVHRIDKDTSGLLVAAKTELAHRSLGRQFAAHKVERVYQAVVWGAPREPAGTIETFVNRSPANRQKMAVVHSGGKHAITHYLVTRLFAPGRPYPDEQPDWNRVAYGDWRGVTTATLLECRLETGRTHQVRVHLSHIGHPLISDGVYGRNKTVPGLEIPITRQSLHAAVLGFHHPKTNKKLRFEAQPPDDFQALLDALENYMLHGGKT